MSFPLALALSSVASLAPIALALPQEESSGPPRVERRYSVARLITPQEESDLQIDLAPTSRFEELGRERVAAELASEAPLYGDALLDLLQSCVAPEQWGVDEHSARVIEHELVVTAPLEVQAEVAAFLAQLSRALATHAQLEVRVLSPVPAGAAFDGAFAAGGARPIAQADAALAEAQQGGATLVRSATLQLRDAVVQRLRAGASRAQVVDFAVEIAHAIAAAAPIHRELRLGLELAARSTRLERATLLDLALREVEPTEERPKEIPGSNMLLLDEEALDRPAAGAVAETRNAFVSLAGTFRLDDGAALWIPCQVETIDGPASFLVDLRVVGDERPLSTRFAVAPHPDDATPRQFVVGSRGGRGLGGIEIGAPKSWLFDAFMLDDDATGYATARFAAARAPDADADRLRDAARLADDDELAMRPGYLFARVSDASLPRLEAALAARAAVPPPLALSATLRDGAGRTLARFAAPLIAGRPLALWSGRERLRLADWDVDVACDANGNHPEIEPAIEGFALRFLARRAIGGNLDLDVDGALRFALEPPKLRALGDAEQRALDHERVRVLALQETRRFGAAGGQVVLGSGDLSLELSLTNAIHAPRETGTPPSPSRVPVERRLPIGSLRAEVATDAGTIALLPIATGANTLPAAGSADLQQKRDAETLFDDSDLELFATAAVAPETWSDDAASVTTDGDELVVRAPLDVADRVAARMAWLDARLAPSRELRVRVRTADGRREIAMLRAALRDRIPARLMAGTRETDVRDWEIEICERSSGADPISGELFAGLELVARCEAVAGGTLLALALSASEPAAPTGRYEPTAIATLHSESTLFKRRACGSIDQPRSAFLGFSGELFLAEGATARVPCRVAGVGGPCDLVLEIELFGTPPPLPDRPGQHLLAVTELLPDAPREGLFDDGWAAAFDGGDESLESCLLGHLATTRETFLPLLDDELPADRLADALSGALSIEATLEDARGGVLASFAVAPLGGRRLVVAGGVEGRRIAGWEVDVANDAATFNPDVEAWVDGFVVSLAPSRDGAGRSLRVVAAACLLDEPPLLRALDDAAKLSVEELRARRLHLDQFVALPDAGGTVTLGGGELRLKLRCTPLAPPVPR
ncbi:MAG: hypothetical protein JNL90_16735 [Planctomycetes bacterium]|nr:hypothetical protein [Planctomycetota bacterium]